MIGDTTGVVRQYALHRRFLPKVKKITNKPVIPEIGYYSGNKIEVLVVHASALRMSLPELSLEELNWAVNRIFDGAFKEIWEAFDDLKAQELVSRIKRCSFIGRTRYPKEIDGKPVMVEEIEFRLPPKIYRMAGNLNNTGNTDQDMEEYTPENRDPENNVVIPNPPDSDLTPDSTSAFIPAEPERTKEHVPDNHSTCPYCGSPDAPVIKEWVFRGLTTKRHECVSCHKKFNTYYDSEGNFKYLVKN